MVDLKRCKECGHAMEYDAINPIRAEWVCRNCNTPPLPGDINEIARLREANKEFHRRVQQAESKTSSWTREQKFYRRIFKEANEFLLSNKPVDEQVALFPVWQRAVFGLLLDEITRLTAEVARLKSTFADWMADADQDTTMHEMWRALTGQDQPFHQMEKDAEAGRRLLNDKCPDCGGWRDASIMRICSKCDGISSEPSPFFTDAAAEGGDDET